MECQPVPRRSRAARWLAVRLAGLAALTLVVPVPWPEAPTPVAWSAAGPVPGRVLPDDFPPRSAPVPTTSTTTTTTAPPPTTEPPIPATTAPPAPTTTAPPAPAAPAPTPAAAPAPEPADPLASCIPAHALTLVPRPEVRVEHIGPGIAGLYTPGLIRLRPGWTCFVVAHEWGHHLTLTVAGRQAADAPDVEHIADCIAELVGHPRPGRAPAGYGCTPAARPRARVLLQGQDPFPQPAPRPPAYGGELHRVVRGGEVTVVPPAGYSPCATVSGTGAGLTVACTGTGIRVAATPDAPGGMRVVNVQDADGHGWSVTVAVVEAGDA